MSILSDTNASFQYGDRKRVTGDYNNNNLHKWHCLDFIRLLLDFYNLKYIFSGNFWRFLLL